MTAALLPLALSTGLLCAWLAWSLHALANGDLQALHADWRMYAVLPLAVLALSMFVRFVRWTERSCDDAETPSPGDVP